MPPLLLFLLISLLVLLASVSAFFSGMETALFSISGLHLRRWRERDPGTARKFEELMKDPRPVLSTILLIDTLVNIVLIVSVLAFTGSIETPVPAWLKTLLAFTLVVFVCELLPKLLARFDPFRFAKVSLRILAFATPLIDPLARGLRITAEKLVSRFIHPAAESGEQMDDDGLLALVELSAEEGLLRGDEREMILGILKLGDKAVKDCMTPRVDVFFLPDHLTNDEAVRELRIHREGRVPVYAESPDEILGVLDVKQFLFDPSEHFTERLDPPSFVPETMPVLDLLRAFLTHSQRLAIVLDEFGGMEGVITLNNIVEEVLGDVAPRQDDPLYLEETSTGKWLASGSARLEDLGEAFGLQLNQEGVDTANGLIFNHLGFVPKPGTRLKIGALEFLIRQSSRTRVLEIEVQRAAPARGSAQ